VFLDEKGQEMRSDVAGALIATELLLRMPSSRVAYDLRCTSALAQRIKMHKGRPLPGPVEPVAFAQHVRRTESIYGCDLSAVHHFKSFFRFPSPFVAFMLMCAHLTRNPQPVSELCEDVRRFEQTGEEVLPMASPEAAMAVLEHVRDAVPRGDRDLVDGVTVRMDGWWFNLRRPGKASELRLNIEAADRRRMREARRTVDSLIKNARQAVE
jgi:phosphomannomutase/phosphoglucomutase